LQDPKVRARLGTNARQFTRRIFDVNQMVLQIERTYEKLLRQKCLPEAKLEVDASLEKAA
jgi:hypothetical protein